MDKNEKPKPPDGMREVPVGESIKAGDLKWDVAAKKWIKISHVKDLSVTERRAGLYCRKIE